MLFRSAFLTTKKLDGYAFDSSLKVDPSVVSYCVDTIKAYPEEAGPAIALGLILKSYKEDAVACDYFYLGARLGYPSFYKQYCEGGKARKSQRYTDTEFDEINRKSMEEVASSCLQTAENIAQGKLQYPSSDSGRFCYLAALVYSEYPAVVRASGIIFYRLGNLEEAENAFSQLRYLKTPNYQPDNTAICSDVEMRNKVKSFNRYCETGPRYYTVPRTTLREDSKNDDGSYKE